MSPKRLAAWVLSGLSSYSERFRLPWEGGGGRRSASCFRSTASRGSLRDSLYPSLKRVLRNHTAHINRGQYSDPASPRGLPKITHRQQPDSTLYCLKHEAARQGQRAETGRLNIWEIKTQLRGQSDQVWNSCSLPSSSSHGPEGHPGQSGTWLELQVPVRMKVGFPGSSCLLPGASSISSG